MNNQIFKLIFEHDLRLDELTDRNTHGNPKLPTSSLEDFLKPDPTFSKLYFTGTDLDRDLFGLNQLSAYTQILDAIDAGLNHAPVRTQQASFPSLTEAISTLEPGQAVVIGNEEPEIELSTVFIDYNSNVGHLKSELRTLLEQDLVVIYKEQAKNGFDLHLFSRKNVYRDIFFPLQALVPEAFRFFSINGKKFRSERHFYFETWTLDRPPHGFEEVFTESVL
ncbi:MAG: hypothetical protein AAFW89_02410 [Bacteroidota bacterium]